MPDDTVTYTAERLTDVRRIRHDLADHLGADGVPDACVDDVVVMTSELVANALDHARSPASITVTRRADDVLVSVHDRSQELPVLRASDPGRVGGNGLRIVQAMADEWGAVRRPGDGKAVWFTRRVG